MNFRNDDIVHALQNTIDSLILYYVVTIKRVAVAFVSCNELLCSTQHWRCCSSRLLCGSSAGAALQEPIAVGSRLGVVVVRNVVASVRVWPTSDRVRVELDLDALAICRANAVVQTGLHAGLLDRDRSSDHGVASANVPAWIVARQRYRVAQYATSAFSQA